MDRPVKVGVAATTPEPTDWEGASALVSFCFRPLECRFAGMLEVLRHLQQTLCLACDPISGDLTCFLYRLLLTLPSIRQP